MDCFETLWSTASAGSPLELAENHHLHRRCLFLTVRVGKAPTGTAVQEAKLLDLPFDAEFSPQLQDPVSHSLVIPESWLPVRSVSVLRGSEF